MEEMEYEIKIIRQEMVNGITMQAKAKWRAESEKGTHSFCNLEKKCYLEKMYWYIIYYKNLFGHF
jgi:hypothetical protein